MNEDFGMKILYVINQNVLYVGKCWIKCIGGFAKMCIRDSSHASLLVEMGFTPLAIADRLGHEKIETTLNTYSHLYPNKQGELADLSLIHI